MKFLDDLGANSATIDDLHFARLEKAGAFLMMHAAGGDNDSLLRGVGRDNSEAALANIHGGFIGYWLRRTPHLLARLWNALGIGASLSNSLNNA